MDAVTVVNPFVEEVAEGAAEQMMKVLYTTGNIVVIDAKDLKNFAIRAGVVAVWGGVMYWSWKTTWKPEWEDHKAKKKAKKAFKDNLQALKDEAKRGPIPTPRTDGNTVIYKIMLTQKGTNNRTPVTVRVPMGTSYKQAKELARQGKAEIIDEPAK